MKNYYNEFDPKAAAWLKQLIVDGHIPKGEVDERSITEVRPADLDGFVQCHFFAGIGGWPEALRLAGWPSDYPVWTGSCPCQPFSCAGQGKGEKDKRHLWPDFRRLIAERNPPTIFGEQVASSLGRRWLAGVRTDLENSKYAFGGADLCAAGVGAPHLRQRMFWVAYSEGRRRGEFRGASFPRNGGHADIGVTVGTLADTNGREIQRNDRKRGCRRIARFKHAADVGAPSEVGGLERGRFWDEFDIIACRDGKARRVESGSFPLVDGFFARVDLLRGFGNAIVPELAAQFIQASEEALFSQIQTEGAKPVLTASEHTKISIAIKS